MYVTQRHTTVRQVTVCSLVPSKWNGVGWRGLWTNTGNGSFVVTHNMSQHLLTPDYCSTS
jgi:hypothetical protein